MPSTEATTTEDQESAAHKRPAPSSDVAGDFFGDVFGGVLSNSMGEPREGNNSPLSNPALSRPVNSSFRSVAFKHAQQTRGNQFVQRAIIQRKLAPGPLIQRECACGGTCSACKGSLSAANDQVAAAKSESAPFIQTKRAAGSTNSESGTHDFTLPGGGGEPLADSPRDLMESRFGVDLGNVRIHRDESAAASAESLGANAFTLGRDIYFGRGKYTPESSVGQRLLGHELVHTLQQRDSDTTTNQSIPLSHPNDPLEAEADHIADEVVETGHRSPVSRTAPVIARDTEPQPYSTSAAISATTGIKADAWVAKHGANLMARVGYMLSLAEIELGTPFVSWKEGQRRQFLIDFWAPFWVGQGNAWNLLTTTLAPDKPEKAVNSGRDSYPWDLGTEEWRDAVVGEVYKLYMIRLRESLARLAPRWRSVKNQLALQFEAGDKTADRDPSSAEVRASHPIDTYVIGALPGKLVVDVVGYRAANPEAASKREIRSALRPVVFEFQIGSGAWNWIQVSSPMDATPEEVAQTLYGSETQAYRLTPARPLFGFDDVWDLLPEHKQRYYKETGKTAAAPTKVSLKQFGTPTNQILAGPLADEAALLQAGKIKASTSANPAAVLDRFRVIVRAMDRVSAIVKGVGLGLPVSADVVGIARKRVDERSIKLSKAAPEEILEWDAQTRGQLELVNAAEAGLLVARQQQEVFKGWPSVGNVISYLGSAYAQVAESSEFLETGRYWLNFAEDQSRLFPITLMDLLLGELRHAMAEAKTDKTGVVTAAQHEAVYGMADMEKREAKLRESLVKVRDVVLQHPEQAKAILEPLFKEIADLQVEVTLVTNMDQCDRAWRALYESLSVVGEIRSIWGGGNEIVSKAMGDATRLNTEWSEIYLEYKYRDKEKAKEQLTKKTKSPEWTGFMEHIRQVLKDQATYDKWMTFAIMVGIAILTAGIGAYVEAAAGAAWGATAGFLASTVVEAATFTTLSYGLVAKDPSIAGFFKDFGKNLLTFGALKVISRVYRLGVGVEAAATAEGKIGEMLVQFVALNGAALYEADQEKRKKTGTGLTADEIGEISLNNLAFLVAVSIGAKLAEPWITQLHLTGEWQGNLARIESTRVELVNLAEAVKGKGGKDPVAARKMLGKQAELLALQEKALTRLEQIATDPKAAAAAGVNTKDIETLTAKRGELTEALTQLQQAHVASQLESVGQNDFLCPRGEFFDSLKKFFEGQHGPGSVNDAIPEDPVTKARSIEVTPKDGSPFRVTERISKAAGEVGAGAEEATEVDPSGGRYGLGNDWDMIMDDPHPSPEVLELREKIKKQLADKGDEWILKHRSMMRSVVQPEMAKLRLALILRSAREIPVVAKALRAFGIRTATNKMIETVFRYNFESSGLSFTYDNFAAWTRLANGKGTIGDVRYVVHEMAEIGEFKKAGFEYMGEGLEIGTPEHLEWYSSQFEPQYIAAHSKALFAEFKFLAGEVSKATGGKVRLTTEEAAAIDPTNAEAREYMNIPDKDGGQHLLKDDPQFVKWEARGTEPVQLSAEQAKQLGLPEKTTLAELLGKIKEKPIHD